MLLFLRTRNHKNENHKTFNNLKFIFHSINYHHCTKLMLEFTYGNFNNFNTCPIIFIS